MKHIMVNTHLPHPTRDGELFDAVNVCQSCLDGEHLSYGVDHRDGEDGRCDCKNVSEDGKSQCGCNPDWPELMEAIENYDAEVHCTRLLKELEKFIGPEHGD